MVRLLIATLTNAHGGIYNAGCGQSISVSDLARAVGALTSEPKPVRVTGEARRDEILDVVADISRAKTDFRWEPEIDLREGLRETIRWMQSVAAQSR
jgi:nucleoside-diphosphate-sugar epimerase